MVAIVNYAIYCNVCFTSGYFQVEQLPVYFLPKDIFVQYFLAFALAAGVNFLVLPRTSRMVFLVSLILQLT
jgi:hypothetical protein